MRRAAGLLLAGMLWAAGAHAGALAVGRAVWGFDGRVVPERINLLSVELTNASAAPVEPRLRLVRSFRLGGRLGAPLEQQCYLSPGATRWVQFYPYVPSDDDVWTLELGMAARVELKPPKLGAPARVLLQDPETPLAGGRLPTFPDHLFPPTVAATDGLHSVVLDHVPHWEPVRRQAFLDWLRRGGQVHVLHDVHGRYPVFGAGLAALDAPLGRLRVGAGLVIRHPCPRRDATPALLAGKGFPSPELKENKEGHIHDLNSDLLRALGGASHPRHCWPLIYLAAMAYVGFLGIYHFFYARRQRDWRRTLLVFFATVAACSLLLGFIGKRGQGEAAAVHAIAYARQLDTDHYDVAQWHNVFVTTGALYAIAHDAPHGLYATCQTEEPVKGLIRNGKGGSLVADIPLFSSRAFLLRGKLEGHHIRLTVKEWHADARLRRLVVEPDDGFPTDAPLMVALYRGAYYPVELADGVLRARPMGAAAAQYLRRRELERRDPWRKPPDPWDNPRQFRDRTGFGALVCPLLAHAAGGTRDCYRQIAAPAASRGQVELFIVARSPATFGALGKRLGRHRGFVVYHVRLLKPETPDG